MPKIEKEQLKVDAAFKIPTITAEQGRIDTLAYYRCVGICNRMCPSHINSTYILIRQNLQDIRIKLEKRR